MKALALKSKDFVRSVHVLGTALAVWIFDRNEEMFVQYLGGGGILTEHFSAQEKTAAYRGLRFILSCLNFQEFPLFGEWERLLPNEKEDVQAMIDAVDKQIIAKTEAMLNAGKKEEGEGDESESDQPSA